MKKLKVLYFTLLLSLALQADSSVLINKTIAPFYKKSLVAIDNQNQRGVLLDDFEEEVKKEIFTTKINTKTNKRLIKNPISNIGIWLNWEKKVLARMSPISKKILAIYPKLGKKAVYLGVKAHFKTIKLYGKKDLYLNEADAFRHAYWNALMVKYINYEFATLWSVSHEIRKESQKFSYKNTEAFMDLLNNTIGRLIGEEHLDKSDSELVDIIIDEIEKGNLYKLKNNKTRKLVFTDE